MYFKGCISKETGSDTILWTCEWPVKAWIWLHARNSILGSQLSLKMETACQLVVQSSSQVPFTVHFKTILLHRISHIYPTIPYIRIWLTSLPQHKNIYLANSVVNSQTFPPSEAVKNRITYGNSLDKDGVHYSHVFLYLKSDLSRCTINRLSCNWQCVARRSRDVPRHTYQAPACEHFPRPEITWGAVEVTHKMSFLAGLSEHQAAQHQTRGQTGPELRQPSTSPSLPAHCKQAIL